MPFTAASLSARSASQARAVRAAAKPGIHPEMHKAKVVCNGEEVYEITGTQAEYNVDLWSGNHPFYQGMQVALVLDEGQVNKFKSRYAGLGALSNVKTANDAVRERKESKQ